MREGGAANGFAFVCGVRGMANGLAFVSCAFFTSIRRSESAESRRTDPSVQV